MEGRIRRKGAAMSEAGARWAGLPSGYAEVSFVIARHGGDVLEVLCVSPVAGERTLPAFTDREAARRFLRSCPLRFGLLGSGWRVRRCPGGALAALLLAPRAGLRRVVLDPSPKTLCGEYLAAPAAGVAGLAVWPLAQEAREAKDTGGRG